MGETNRFGWSFSSEMDALTRVLPFAVAAFVAIDRDCDEVVSREEFEEWFQGPFIEHRREMTKWEVEALGAVEDSLPMFCKRGMDGPDGLVATMQSVCRQHFNEGRRASLTLRDFVYCLMKVVAEGPQAKAEAA